MYTFLNFLQDKPKIDFLFESKEGKNVHLEHIEDQVLNGGVYGTREAIFLLISIKNSLAGHETKRKVNITTKFDGAPAIISGRNPENGKFFVATKGAFAATPKLNYTFRDIDNNHSNPGLNDKLKLALKHLPELNIPGILQGDFMFSYDDLKQQTIDGERYITFQPNTITYAVPVNTTLADQISRSKMGIVWHTAYHGNTIKDLKASYGVNVGILKPSKNVWFRDASYVDSSGSATFTKTETDKLESILSDIGLLFRRISPRTLDEIANNKTYNIQIKAWNNKKVRSGEEITDTAAHVRGLIKSIEESLNRNILDAKKTDTRMKREKEKSVVMTFYRRNAEQLKLIFDLQNKIIEAKTIIIRKLEEIKDIGTFINTGNGYKATAPEGFVAVDHIGNAVKLVDRLTFSHYNFNITKQWK